METVKCFMLVALAGLWMVEAGDVSGRGTKNASYFVSPKQFLTYVGQMDKIKSLGEEVHCKLRGGSCNEKKHKIAGKTSKKSARPRDRMPDNHNNVLSPDALMSPVAGGMLGGGDYTQQPEGAIRVARSAPSEVLQVNVTAAKGENVTDNTPIKKSSANDSVATLNNTASLTIDPSIITISPKSNSNASSSPPFNTSSVTSPLGLTTHINETTSLQHNSTIIETGRDIEGTSKPVKPVDSQASKKSLRTFGSENLPPIYLTVRNGEKVLVVHPTTEFLQSLPRINFTTDPASEKPLTRSSGAVRMRGGYTGNYAKRDEMLKLMKKEKMKVYEEEEDGDDNDDDDDEGPDDDEDDDEGRRRRSHIAHTATTNRRISWLRKARSEISQRDGIRNNQHQMNNMYTTEDYMKGERKSTELPVPRAIQNLYQKFHPEHSQANFNYIPSRDEVAEELQYAQQSASLNRAMQGNPEQNGESDLQAGPEADYGSDGDVGDGGAATMSNNEPSWEQKYKNLDSDGRKRSDNPMYDYPN